MHESGSLSDEGSFCHNNCGPIEFESTILYYAVIYKDVDEQVITDFHFLSTNVRKCFHEFECAMEAARINYKKLCRTEKVISESNGNDKESLASTVGHV